MFIPDLSLDSIIVKQDYNIDPDIIRRLANSIKETGLINPVTVCNGDIKGEYELRAGRKRIKAVRLLGWKGIDVVVKDVDKLHKELIEIDENLVRDEFNYLERGELLKKRKEIYEQLHPETKCGGDRKSEAYKSKRNHFVLKSTDEDNSDTDKIVSPLVDAFTKDTAEKTGLCRRTIQHDIQIAENLENEAKQKVKELGVSKVGALKLARLKPALQKKVVENLSLTNKDIETEIDKTYKEQKIGNLTANNDDTDDIILIQKAGYEPKVFDVWTFNLIDSFLGKANITGISPGIFFNLLYHYSKQGDVVICPMEMENELIGDICAVMKRKYTTYYHRSDKADLALIDLTSKGQEEYLSNIENILNKVKKKLKDCGHIAVIVQNIYEEGIYEDYVFNVFTVMKEAGLKIIRRISAPLNTQYYQAVQINRTKKAHRMLGLVRDILIVRN